MAKRSASERLDEIVERLAGLRAVGAVGLLNLESAAKLVADTEMTPDKYYKEYGKCPPGYHFDGDKCRPADEAKKDGKGSSSEEAEKKGASADPPQQSKLDPHTDSDGDGVADAARVGVPGREVPPPPGVERLKGLLSHEREMEESFASAFESDPDGVTDQYLEHVKRTVDEKGPPPTFVTDDAKLLSSDYNPEGVTPEELGAARARTNVLFHNTANAIAKRAFLKHLDDLEKLPKDDPKRSVLVTAGGCASGKGFCIKNVSDAKAIKDKSGAIWDAAGEQNSTENPWILEECRKRGLKASFIWCDADPMLRWSDPRIGAVQRAATPPPKGEGRMVDARLYADSYALGVKNFQAFHEANKDAEDVSFVFLNTWNTDESGFPKMEKADGIDPRSIELDADDLYKKATEAIATSAPTEAIKFGATIGQRIWGPPQSGAETEASVKGRAVKVTASKKRTPEEEELADALMENYKANVKDLDRFYKEKAEQDAKAPRVKKKGKKGDDKGDKDKGDKVEGSYGKSDFSVKTSAGSADVYFDLTGRGYLMAPSVPTDSDRDLAKQIEAKAPVGMDIFFQGKWEESKDPPGVYRRFYKVLSRRHGYSRASVSGSVTNQRAQKVVLLAVKNVKNVGAQAWLRDDPEGGWIKLAKEWLERTEDRANDLGLTDAQVDEQIAIYLAMMALDVIKTNFKKNKRLEANAEELMEKMNPDLILDPVDTTPVTDEPPASRLDVVAEAVTELGLAPEIVEAVEEAAAAVAAVTEPVTDARALEAFYNTEIAGNAGSPEGFEEWLSTLGPEEYASAVETGTHFLQPKALEAGYRDDPRWMTAKFPGKARDGTRFKAGDKILYYPKTRDILVGEKAEKAWRDFEAGAADERMMSGSAEPVEKDPLYKFYRLSIGGHPAHFDTWKDSLTLEDKAMLTKDMDMDHVPDLPKMKPIKGSSSRARDWLVDQIPRPESMSEEVYQDSIDKYMQRYAESFKDVDAMLSGRKSSVSELRRLMAEGSRWKATYLFPRKDMGERTVGSLRSSFIVFKKADGTDTRLDLKKSKVFEKNGVVFVVDESLDADDKGSSYTPIVLKYEPISVDAKVSAAGMRSADEKEFAQAVSRAGERQHMFAGKPDTGSGSMDVIYKDRGTEVARKTVVFKRGKAVQTLFMVNPDFVGNGPVEGSAVSALTAYMYKDPVDKDELRSLIIRAVVSDPDDIDVAAALPHLLAAEEALFGKSSALMSAAAEDFLRTVYEKGGGDGESFDLPESLSGATEIPKWLLTPVGQAMAEEDEHTRRALRKAASVKAGSDYTAGEMAVALVQKGSQPFNRDTMEAIYSIHVPVKGPKNPNEESEDVGIQIRDHSSSGVLTRQQEKAGAKRETTLLLSIPKGQEKVVLGELQKVLGKDFKVEALQKYRKAG